MKTLRLAILALLVTSSVVVFANNNKKVNNVITNQQELYESFKTTLVDNGILDKIESNTQEILVVYCNVDDNQHVTIEKIDGYNKEIKENVMRIISNYPIKAKKHMVGNEVAFKLRFDVK